jgi:hypothetical protein
MSETIDNGKPIREMAGEVLSLSRRHPPASDVVVICGLQPGHDAGSVEHVEPLFPLLEVKSRHMVSFRSPGTWS